VGGPQREHRRGLLPRLRLFRPEVTWAAEVVDPAKVNRGYGLSKKIIMFPSSHDITPAILESCLTVLGKLLAAGNQVLVVSKPHEVCVTRLCAELAGHRGGLEFRFTITSASDELLARWEPGAPRYQERLRCLDLALAANFTTSVSVEPFLDEDPVPLCRTLLARPDLHELWIGCMNYKNFPNYAPAKLAAIRTALSPDPRVRFKESFTSREAPA
jgi:hypothetical protein